MCRGAGDLAMSGQHGRGPFRQEWENDEIGIIDADGCVVAIIPAAGNLPVPITESKREANAQLVQLSADLEDLVIGLLADCRGRTTHEAKAWEILGRLGHERSAR